MSSDVTSTGASGIARDNDHALVADSPLARGAVLNNDTLVDTADYHGASPAQISLCWLLDIGVVPILKATSGAHIRENFQALNVELIPNKCDQVAQIDAVADRLIRTLIRGDWSHIAKFTESFHEIFLVLCPSGSFFRLLDVLQPSWLVGRFFCSDTAAK